jgi:L-asparagine transporter-like permease
VASVSNLSYMIIVSSVGLAVLKLRKHEKEDTYKIPLYPLSSYLCILLPIILIPFLEWHSLIIGIIWISIGLIINKVMKRKMKKPKEMLAPTKIEKK